MNPIRFVAAVSFVLTCALTSNIIAQDRGRTDGPEGSEYGVGDYRRPSQQYRISIAPEFGVAISAKEAGTDYGVPLYAGGAITFRGLDSVFFDVAGHYNFWNKRTDVLAGPRFRFGFGTMAFDLGVRAGLLVLKGGDIAAVFSPMARMEARLTNRIFTGIGYSLDIPLQGDDLSHRIGIDLGVRF